MPWPWEDNSPLPTVFPEWAPGRRTADGRLSPVHHVFITPGQRKQGTLCINHIVQVTPRLLVHRFSSMCGNHEGNAFGDNIVHQNLGFTDTVLAENFN